MGKYRCFSPLFLFYLSLSISNGFQVVRPSGFRSYSFNPLTVRLRQSNSRLLPSLASAPSNRATASFPSKNNGDRPKSPKVLFQKVLQVYDADFLASLVDYLELFDLPKSMPMIYEKTVPDNNDNTKDSAIVIWDSPLSPSADATRLNVNVVAIANSDAEATGFQMLMVVVQKQSLSTSTLPTMMKQLFDDCEKRIIKSFDRALEAFAVEYASKANKRVQKAKDKQQLVEQALLAELMSDDDDDDDEDRATRVSSSKKEPSDQTIIDVTKTTTTDSNPSPTPVNEEARKAAIKTMQRPAYTADTGSSASVPATSQPSGVDFAVQAAKQAVQKQKKSGKQDFAVQAAMRAAKKKTLASPVSEKKEISVVTKESTSIDESIDWSKFSKSPMLADDKRFVTISTPSDYVSKRKKTSSTDPRSSTNQDSTPPSTRQDVSSSVVSASRQSTVAKTKTEISSSGEKKAKEKLESLLEIEAETVDKVDEELTDSGINMANEEALSEIAKQAQDMSPEELLQSVMKYGDEQEQVFASSAFEKAKELLRQQKQNREVRLREKIVDNVARHSGTSQKFAPEVKELSPEEELRRMFQAGEQIAETRMSTVTDDKVMSEADARLVNSVIAADEDDLPNYARELDDDLVELAMRINKSPGEELDGKKKNPIFDVFTGPDVYNPNVDAETAVNWPGALPGTRDIKLPKDLREAVKNAQFAADVLMKMQQEGSKYYIGKREITDEQIQNLQTVVDEAVEIGLIPNPLDFIEERSRLQMVLNELWTQPDERFQTIASNFKDLIMSENFPALIRERLRDMTERDLDALRRDDESLEEGHARERHLLGQLVAYAQLLLKETRALGAELEASHLEVIRSICKVAMDPSHRTEEETAMALTDAVRDMRPLLDDSFVAYLKYAVDEEEGRLARAGQLDDPDHYTWLYVLKIIQQGVYAELGKGVSRYVDHIFYVLRMKTAEQRTMLLQKLIDVMPTLDVRPFVRVVDNIVSALGDSVAGEFKEATELGEMTNKLLQLRRDVKMMLPPERIALMSKDADDWAERKKAQLKKSWEIRKQRLNAARDTEYLEGDIEALE